MHQRNNGVINLISLHGQCHIVKCKFLAEEDLGEFGESLVASLPKLKFYHPNLTMSHE